VIKYPDVDSTWASLCGVCHGDQMKEWDSLEVVHAPMAKGRCDACHAAHTGHDGLISDRVDRVCGQCHDIGPSMTSKHGGIDLNRANCVDCHNPHASATAGLLNPVMHPPFADAECASCHREEAGRLQRELAEEPPALCANCHEDYSQGGPAVTVHAPVESGECTACHSAHAAVEEHLLRARGPALCSDCHELDVTGVSVHRPVADADCLTCHPAHRAEGDELTVRQGSDLCFECHTDLAERFKVQLVHAPVDEDCGHCHTSHAADQPHLLKSELGDLCAGCHTPDAAWRAKHLGGEIKGGCIQCHDPHAVPRGQKALLYEYEHEPFAAGDCESCHTAGLSQKPVDCTLCHDEVLAAAVAKPVTHPPVVDAECLACHSAHAAPVPHLLPGDGPRTCGGCHESVTAATAYVHPPLATCQTCHDAHGGEHARLLTAATEDELCVTCHEGSRERHFHPMGDEVIDPNTRAPLTCSGCHDPHRSDYENLLRAEPRRGLCVLCHEVMH
jgi:predicted CXXCH cytochrome family protein